MKKGKETYLKKITGFFLVIAIMVCSIELVFTIEERHCCKSGRKDSKSRGRISCRYDSLYSIWR